MVWVALVSCERSKLRASEDPKKAEEAAKRKEARRQKYLAEGKTEEQIEKLEKARRREARSRSRQRKEGGLEVVDLDRSLSMASTVTTGGAEEARAEARKKRREKRERSKTRKLEKLEPMVALNAEDEQILASEKTSETQNEPEDTPSNPPEEVTQPPEAVPDPEPEVTPAPEIEEPTVQSEESGPAKVPDEVIEVENKSDEVIEEPKQEEPSEEQTKPEAEEQPQVEPEKVTPPPPPAPPAPGAPVETTPAPGPPPPPAPPGVPDTPSPEKALAPPPPPPPAPGAVATPTALSAPPPPPPPPGAPAEPEIAPEASEDPIQDAEGEKEFEDDDDDEPEMSEKEDLDEDDIAEALDEEDSQKITSEMLGEMSSKLSIPTMSRASSIMSLAIEEQSQTEEVKKKKSKFGFFGKKEEKKKKLRPSRLQDIYDGVRKGFGDYISINTAELNVMETQRLNNPTPNDQLVETCDTLKSLLNRLQAQQLEMDELFENYNEIDDDWRNERIKTPTQDMLIIEQQESFEIASLWSIPVI